MYAADPMSKFKGALAMSVPGELAGLHAAWSSYGRLPWKSLFVPAIKLARDGYTVVPYVANALKAVEANVLADPGLRAVFAPEGQVLVAGALCRNPALADTWTPWRSTASRCSTVAPSGRGSWRTVEVSAALRADAMGFTFLGMPPPSSGTVGMALVLNILGGYKSAEFLRGFLGVHRLVEAVKHMLAVRMDLGDPGFVNAAGIVSEMLSPAFADKVRQRIADNTTFPPAYYLPKWSQLRDNGTSHLCVVDGDRNAVAMTTTVNYYFGAQVLSPSTGIVLNNEMDDFSMPSSYPTPDHLPPPTGAGQLHRGGKAAALIDDTDDHPQGWAAGWRGGRKRRHQHHCGGDTGVPEPLRPGDEPSGCRAEPKGVPQSRAECCAVRGRDSGRWRGHRAQSRGERVFAAEGSCAQGHCVVSRVPDDSARLAGASVKRQRERVPRDADGRERSKERR
ncbi:hypothetical protein CFC21_045909 [Triticum aestivum]|uniref:Gamma-glutamyltranspeptidase n=2 Tax=Triticum aestivum TaxID=4565 RepID=A0A9R1FTB7_WHEAT|nr:hypothetical protein CFC21_045909 [Triticum aestivum]